MATNTLAKLVGYQSPVYRIFLIFGSHDEDDATSSNFHYTQAAEHLLEEMKRRKLQDGWDEIFLEPWALHEISSVCAPWLRCHLRDRRLVEIESASSEGKSF
jgi:hypothetical protein